MQPRYKTKQVISGVSEKIKLKKWVMRIEFELWDLSYKNWVMGDAQIKKAKFLRLGTIKRVSWSLLILLYMRMRQWGIYTSIRKADRK